MTGTHTKRPYRKLPGTEKKRKRRLQKLKKKKNGCDLKVKAGGEPHYVARKFQVIIKFFPYHYDFSIF